MEMSAIGKQQVIYDKKIKGQFFTPKFLAEAIVLRLLPHIDLESKSLRILDPSIGKGIFSKLFIPYLIKTNQELELIGLDIDKKALQEAKLELTHFSNNKINLCLKHMNFLTDYPVSNHKESFDVCLSNPPHNAKLSPKEWSFIDNQHYLPPDYQIYHESSIFFVLKSLKIMKQKGILCYILPKPIIYSKRWKMFRKFLLENYMICEILDIGNLFPLQLQEQIVLILKKSEPSSEYITSTWNSKTTTFTSNCKTNVSDALLLDNLLISINQEEKKIIKKLYSKEYQNLPINAFRGVGSSFKSDFGDRPLIEKSSLGEGFLFPPRYYLDKSKLIGSKIKSINLPKIIAQRIISYQIKPVFRFKLKVYVDLQGIYIPNETCVCIIPSTNISIYGLAAILQSTFIEWWLRHAVYAKQFVTSKDFDQAYIRAIRIPRLNYSLQNPISSNYETLVSEEKYQDLLKFDFKKDLNTCFVLISNLYQKYQEIGEKYKRMVLDHLLAADEPQMDTKTTFAKFKQIYRESQRLTLTQMEEIKPIVVFFSKLSYIKNVIDDLIFQYFNISEKERRIIEGDLIVGK